MDPKCRFCMAATPEYKTAPNWQKPQRRALIGVQNPHLRIRFPRLRVPERSFEDSFTRFRVCRVCQFLVDCRSIRNEVVWQARHGLRFTAFSPQVVNPKDPQPQTLKA